MISAVSVRAWCPIDSLITASSRAGSRRPASVSRSAFSRLAASAAASKSPSGTSRAEPRRTTTATISPVRAMMPTRVCPLSSRAALTSPRLAWAAASPRPSAFQSCSLISRRSSACLLIMRGSRPPFSSALRISRLSWRSSARTAAACGSAGGRTGLTRNACARERSSQANTSGADFRSSASRRPAAASSAPRAAVPVRRSMLPSRPRRVCTSARPARSSASAAPGRPSRSASSARASRRSSLTFSGVACPRRRTTASCRLASSDRPAASRARAASSSARSASLASPQPRSRPASRSASAAMGARRPAEPDRARSWVSSARQAHASLPCRRNRRSAATAQRRATVGSPAASAACARASSASARS